MGRFYGNTVHLLLQAEAATIQRLINARTNDKPQTDSQFVGPGTGQEMDLDPTSDKLPELNLGVIQETHTRYGWGGGTSYACMHELIRASNTTFLNPVLLFVYRCPSWTPMLIRVSINGQRGVQPFNQCINN